MCDPTTLAAISLGASAIGTGVQVYGQIQAGKAAQAQANYQAAVARNNQIIADRQAEDALKRGDIAEDAHRRKVGQIVGSQIVSLAAQGGTLDEGTPLDILGDTAAAGELDALTIKNNAEREAYGYRTQGANFAAEGNLARLRGAQASAASYTNAFGSLLSGAGQIANNYYTFRYGPRLAASSS